MLPVKRYLAMNTFCRSMTYYQKSHSLSSKGLPPFYKGRLMLRFRAFLRDFKDILFVIKDEVLITVRCPNFPSILIAKYLFTGSLKNRSIDI